MADDNSVSTDSRLKLLLARKAKLQREYADQDEWLREIATLFSSSEEQQRIVSEMAELLTQVRSIDGEIRSLSTRRSAE